MRHMFLHVIKRDHKHVRATGRAAVHEFTRRPLLTRMARKWDLSGRNPFHDLC